jgi:ABC-type uncharacterized transport system substrate-binding protein
MLFSTVLYAHPHCFIDVYPTINKKSIKLKWVFDEMSSQMLCMDYDKDMNGNISHNENYKLEKEAFSLLERYSYYTYFFSKQKRLKTPKYISFQASIKNNKLIYVFTIPRPSQATSIKFYDEEMYTSFILKQEHIKKANPSKKYKFYQLNEDYFVSYELIF